MNELTVAAAGPAVPARSGRRVAVSVERPDGSRGDILVSKPFARLGRDGRAEIALDDPKLLPCHAYLQATREGIYVASLADGVPSGWLVADAPLEIGGFLIHVVADNHERPAAGIPDLQAKHSAQPPYPRLRVFSEKSPGGFTDFALNRRLTLVGRELPSTWRIKHPTLSRIHCAMVWDENQLWLVDLFSSNGTRVGDARFDAGLLEVGQDFRLGMVHCRYVDFAEPRQPTKGAVAASTDRPAEIIETRMSASADTQFVDAPRRPEPSERGAAWPSVENTLHTASITDAGRGHDDRWRELRQQVASIREELAEDRANAAQERQRSTTALANLLASQADARDTIARLNQRLAEQQQTLDEHRSIRSGLQGTSAAQIAELTDRLRAVSEEFEGQRQAHQQEHDEILALVEKLRSDAADRQNFVETALNEFQALAADIAARKAEVQKLTTEVAQHLETERSSADEQRAPQDAWENRLESLSQEVQDLAAETQAAQARLETSLQAKLAAQRKEKTDLGGAQDKAAAPPSAIHEKLAAELARISTTVDAVQEQLSNLATEITRCKSDQFALKSELTCSLEQYLQTLAASADDLDRRLKESMASVARQFLEQREESERRLTQLQYSESAKTQQTADQHENLAGRLGQIEQRLNEQLAQQNSWENRLNELAGDIERRAAEGAQQLQEATASLQSRLADFERAIAAELAVELAKIQRRLREEIACTERKALRKEPVVATRASLPQEPSGLSTEATQPSPSDSETVLTEFAVARSEGDLGDENGASPEKTAGASIGRSSPPLPWLSTGDLPSAEDLPTAGDDVLPAHAAAAIMPSADRADVRTRPAADTAEQEWLANDELTQRLLDFKSKREQSFRKRRLVWGLVLGGLVAGILAAATVVHFWNRSNSTENNQENIQHTTLREQGL